MIQLADRLPDDRRPGQVDTHGNVLLGEAQVGRLLAASRPLPVLGLRAAAPLAAYFAYFAAKVHPDVRVLDDGGSLLADRLAGDAEGFDKAIVALKKLADGDELRLPLTHCSAQVEFERIVREFEQSHRILEQ